MRKLIVGLSLAIAVLAGGSGLVACKVSATAGGTTTAVVDTLKDSTTVDTAKVDTAKADSVK